MNPNDFISGLTSEQSLSMLAIAVSNIDKNLSRIADETVPNIRDDLLAWKNETDRRLSMTESTLSRILVHIDECQIGERVKDIERDHDKFLELCKSVEEHIKQDLPFEYHLGRYAVAIITFVAAAVGAFVMNRILNVF